MSLFPCKPELKLASLTVLPLRFSGAVNSGKSNRETRKRLLRRLASPRLRTWIRQRFVPGYIPRTATDLASIIRRIKPDILHAMRIPYEGMLTAQALFSSDPFQVPFLISVWGNDFTLHAPSTKKMMDLTRLTLKIADGLHTDCIRDQVYAEVWGFNTKDKRTKVLPGSGGVQMDRFSLPHQETGLVVINPRGIRAYIRNDTFFKSIPLILNKYPEIKFICPNMAGQHDAENWVEKLSIRESTTLLPFLDRNRMADLFKQSKIVVSPSEHDGTPNTLLEAMACGCFPIAGDIATIREWITPGVNGLVFNPSKPEDLAERICLVLENGELLDRARYLNVSLVKDRAEYHSTMQKADEFYQELIRFKNPKNASLKSL